MTQKQKGLIGLAVMLVLAVVVLFVPKMFGNGGGKKEVAVSYTPGTYIGTAEGYGGAVVAVVTVSDSKIEAIQLTGEGETAAIGGAALESLATAMLDSQSAQVDAVSGATVTSGAASEAVKQALAQATGEIPVVVTEAVAAETEVETTEEEETEDSSTYYYAEGTYTTSSEGYAGEVMAEVEIADGKIVSVILTGAKETPEVGGAALEKLEKMFVEKQSSRVDVISGATLSCEAAIEAVDTALEDAKQYYEDEDGENLSDLSLADGTYTGSYKGYGGDVTAEIEIKDGEIIAVTLTGDQETPEIGQEALPQLESMFLENQSSEVDIVAGATKTCDAAIEAVELAIAAAEEAYTAQN